MSEYTVLPLLNSAFKPGTAVEVVERFEDAISGILPGLSFFIFRAGRRNVVRLRSLILRMRR